MLVVIALNLKNLTVKLELHQTIFFFLALFFKLVHKKNICKARLIMYFMGKSNFVCSFYQFNFKYIYFK